MADEGYLEKETPQQLRRGTFVVPTDKVIDINENSFIGNNTLSTNDIASENTPSRGEYKGDYRFSVGQLPSWAKKQVIGLHVQVEVECHQFIYISTQRKLEI